MTTRQAQLLLAALLAAPLIHGAATAQTTVTDDQGRSEVIYDVGILHVAPGAQITYDLCTICHSEMIIAQQGQTREGWDEILVWMVEDMGMAELHEEDRAQILDYLATHYNPDRPHFPARN
ncbi:aldehyde dehydrogenase [Roseicyclus sp.]|uniref:aldehyde dehydrogenase n=1 Tax=Roseicyclus sp. TaxID=1914329 RepID=UPI003FA15EF3